MSHFPIIVVQRPGIDPDRPLEEVLQPWHEYECTGIDDQYVFDVDITEESRADFEKHGGGRSFEEFVPDWNGGEVREGRVYRRTNPNKKWDWWVVGGRWSGFFVTHDGRRVDVAEKRRINVAAAREEERAEAARHYDEVATATAGVPRPETWEQMKAKHDGDLDDLRAAYWGQAWFQALHRAAIHLVRPEVFLVERETYVEGRVMSAGVPHAYVVGGKWHEPGEMGWFGFGSDLREDDKWRDQFWAMFDVLPDDAILTAVDCHI